jgi:hypothetical protein
MKNGLKIMLCVLFLGTSLIAHAQIPDSIDGVQISNDPLYPSAGQNVTVKVESYNTNLNAASIVWLADGKRTGQGTGLTSIDITAPALGKTIIITAIIMTAEGKEVQKTITLRPADIDLIWESSGYVPPLFKGKSLFSYQNLIKVSAIPHFASNNGKEMDPKTLVYKWTVNNKVVQDQSGFGKQTLAINEFLPKTFDIEAIVTTKDGTQQGRASINLEPGNPSILFYEEDSLYGVFYNKAMGDRFTITKDEVNVLAVPYFFSSVGVKYPLTYTWSINSIEQPDISKNQSITLRTKGDAEGSSLLSLDIRNQDQILQGAQNSVTLFFAKKQAEQQPTF